MPPIVARQTKLTEAGDGLNFARIWPEPKVTATNRNCLLRWVAGPAHVAIAASVGGIDIVVEAPQQPIDPKLLIAFHESCQDYAALSFTIPAVVPDVQDVRRGCDEHAAFVRQDAVRKRQTVRIDRGFLVPSTVIKLIQEFDSTPCGTERIIGHLGYKHSAILVPRNRNWTDHIGFGSNQFDH